MTMVGGAQHLITEKNCEHEYKDLLGEAVAPALFERIARLRQSSTNYFDKVLVSL